MSFELKIENISKCELGTDFKNLEEKAVLLGARAFATILTRKFGHSSTNEAWDVGKFLRSYEAHTSCDRCEVEIAIMQRGADSHSFRYQTWGATSIATEIQIDSFAIYNSYNDSARVDIKIEKRSLGWFTAFVPVELSAVIHDTDLLNYFCPRYRNLFSPENFT